MANPNNCSTCKHSAQKSQGSNGHCYMFKDSPKSVCMQHTGNQAMFGASDVGLRDLLGSFMGGVIREQK